MSKSDIHVISKADGFEIRKLEKADKSVIGWIDDNLTAFNEEKLGASYKSCVIAAYKNNKLVGGIFFRWYGQHAAIQLLAVDKKLRGQTIGSRLLSAAENELCRQGCRRIIVDTISFQSPDFYRHRGYELIAETPDYLEGVRRLTFGKYLPDRNELR